MLYQMKNIVGGGDAWATTPNGAVQVKELETGYTNVVFEDVPAIEEYGYVVYIDTSLTTPANATPPRQSGQLVYGTISNGLRTVTCNFEQAITSAQNGTLCRLRIIK